MNLNSLPLCSDPLPPRAARRLQGAHSAHCDVEWAKVFCTVSRSLLLETVRFRRLVFAAVCFAYRSIKIAA